MANFLDILQYPQYEQGGRFNLLALPQLFGAAFNPEVRAEATARGDTRRAATDYGANVARARQLGSQNFLKQAQSAPAAGAPELFQPGANLAQTRAETSGIDARTAGQELNNRVGSFNFDEARQGAVDRKAARTKLEAMYGSSPEFVAGQQPYLQSSREGERYQTEKSLSDLGLGEQQRLVEGGQPITQPGQAFASREIAARGHAATLTSEERRADQAAVTSVLSHALSYPTPENMQFARAFAKSKGMDIQQFMGVQSNPAQDVHTQLMQQKSGGQTQPSTKPNSETTPTQPEAAQESGIRTLLKKYPGTLGPNAGQVKTGKNQYQDSPTSQMQSLQQLEQYLSIPTKSGEQTRLRDLEEVRRMIQQLQGGPR